MVFDEKSKQPGAAACPEGAFFQDFRMNPPVTSSPASMAVSVKPPETSGHDWMTWLFQAIQGNPITALLWAAIIGTLIYFFGYAGVFLTPDLEPESVFGWAWRAWNPET